MRLELSAGPQTAGHLDGPSVLDRDRLGLRLQLMAAQRCGLVTTSTSGSVRGTCPSPGRRAGSHPDACSPAASPGLLRCGWTLHRGPRGGRWGGHNPRGQLSATTWSSDFASPGRLCPAPTHPVWSDQIPTGPPADETLSLTQEHPPTLLQRLQCEAVTAAAPPSEAPVAPARGAAASGAVTWGSLTPPGPSLLVWVSGVSSLLRFWNLSII